MEVAALLKASQALAPNLLAASGYMLDRYHTRIIVATISKPEVKVGRYRTTMATAAATTRTRTAAAAPTRTASGVAKAATWVSESQEEGPPPS
jgi:hypothetical protein